MRGYPAFGEGDLGNGRSGWRPGPAGEVQTFEIGRLQRRVVGLATHEIGLMLDEANALLAELQRRIVQTQIDEKVEPGAAPWAERVRAGLADGLDAAPRPRGPPQA